MARTGTQVAVRDSKAPNGPQPSFGNSEFAALITYARK
ncbi:DUF397 domain-containing protein [Actinomadura sp. NBRC 104412]|nr:DUF397 domain-containing protein [Actinomadura sp. NBRC 104412]